MKRDGPTRVRLSRVVLVGLPGAGKSSVGRLLAGRLGWGFRDVDVEIEAAAGMDIATIFRERGESGFRGLEREAVAQALLGEALVIAPGAGWAAQPGAMESVPAATAVVWLEVSAAQAVTRLQCDATQRPLLAGEGMAARIGKMESERTSFYSAANIAVQTDGRTPEAVAGEIAARLVSDYGVDGEAN